MRHNERLDQSGGYMPKLDFYPLWPSARLKELASYLLSMLVISGELDLSAGSVFAFCPIILTMMVASR